MESPADGDVRLSGLARTWLALVTLGVAFVAVRNVVTAADDAVGLPGRGWGADEVERAREEYAALAERLPRAAPVAFVGTEQELAIARYWLAPRPVTALAADTRCVVVATHGRSAVQIAATLPADREWTPFTGAAVNVIAFEGRPR